MKIKAEFKDGEYDYKEFYKLMKTIEKLGWEISLFGCMGGLRFTIEKDDDEVGER